MPLACGCQQIIQILQKTQNNLKNLFTKFPNKASLPDFLFWATIRITPQKLAIVTDSRSERQLAFFK